MEKENPSLSLFVRSNNKLPKLDQFSFEFKFEKKEMYELQCTVCHFIAFKPV